MFSFTACARSYSREEQIADFQNDLRSQGFNPGALEVEGSTPTKKKKVWDSKKKKWVEKKTTTNGDTEIEIKFSFAGCTFEADRKIGEGGDPKVREPFTIEIEEPTEELEFENLQFFSGPDIKSLVGSMPSNERPSCYKP